MTRARVQFDSAATAEAEAAARWYEEREPGLGSDFLAELDRAVSEIARSPRSWQVSPDDSRARRFVLSRFPFSIVYVMRADDHVVVAAVAHAKRRPGYWRERLGRP